MDYKETYEKFWQLAKDARFEDYKRNLILPDFFPAVKNNEKVADIAGGAGIVSKWLGERGYDVSLVEFSDAAILSAKERGIKNIFQNKIEGIGSLPFSDGYFNVVFFGDIIEHLFDPESALREIKRILKPEGRLVISCPNIAYWRFRWYYLIDGDFHRIDVAKQKPWEQEHIRFYSIKILKEFLNKIGFGFVRLKGVNEIWHSRFLVKYFPNLFAHTIVSEFIKK
jgi:2-polyprenyl-3-methyl-5-hydroxy-6-metoxy-1,4-benzoquinol methylase